MSRVRNATDFLLKFREIRERYEGLFRHRIAEIRTTYANNRSERPPPAVDESLEAHSRVYLVNALLAALNWRLDQAPEQDLPNLVPEVPVESSQQGTTRFLDYLGFERETYNPLLVVETKRPSSLLPRLVNNNSASSEEIVSRGLSGERLIGDWSEWLSTLSDYVRSVHSRVQKVPQRVLLTNGDWLILFLDPSDAFLDAGTRDPGQIIVFLDRNDVEARYSELFRNLEYDQVAGGPVALELAEIRFLITGDKIDRLMHGLQLHYFSKPQIYGQALPVINVAPLIFLHLTYGTWVRVELPPAQYELPHDEPGLRAHLAEVQNAATNLLSQVNNRLEISLQPSSLSSHYENGETFEPIRGMVEHRQGQFFVATGDKTHYLLAEPSVPDCPHHDWARSHATGVASNPPIHARSITPRSFFYSSELHHCAHRHVSIAKGCQITAANRTDWGSRSGQDGDAFCEIWHFEQHLCCRTCAFEEVCTKAQAFSLPCQRPIPAGTGIRTPIEG